MAKPPPVPFNDNEWYHNQRTAITRHLKDAGKAPLDGSCRFKLLFPPDEKIQGSTAMVLDLVTDNVRPAEAKGRLLRTTMRPYKEYTPSPEAAAAWQAFKGYYSEHHVLMDGDDEHAEELKKRLIAVVRSGFKWFSGQSNQWVRLGMTTAMQCSKALVTRCASS